MLHPLLRQRVGSPGYSAGLPLLLLLPLLRLLLLCLLCLLHLRLQRVQQFTLLLHSRVKVAHGMLHGGNLQPQGRPSREGAQPTQIVIVMGRSCS